MPPRGYKKTHCNKGHELTLETTGVNSTSGIRFCILCSDEFKRKHYEQNKDNIISALREERKSNPEKFRARELARCHKLTIEKYEDMLISQQGVCAGCGKKPEKEKYGKLSVDHNHACCPQKRNTCGKCVRGLLCRGCNSVLGTVKDSASILHRLADYIEKYKNRQ